MAGWGKRGSTSAWRLVRAYVLARDGHCCQMPRDGRPCGRWADTVDHIVPLADGGAMLNPSNLRAACKSCNCAAGARLANTRRRYHLGSRRIW